MTKPSRSIGLDDTGAPPAGAPEGPYVTDRTDDSRRRSGAPPVGRTPKETADPQRRQRPDLANRRKGPAQP